MADYNIDNVSIEISSESTKAIASIEALTEKVYTLRTAFFALNDSVNTLSGISTIMNRVSSAQMTAAQNTTAFSDAQLRATTIANSFTSAEVSNADKIKASVNSVADSKKSASAKSVSASRKQASGYHEEISASKQARVEGKKLTAMTKNQARNADILGTAFKGLGIAVAYQMARQVGQALGSLITLSNTFIENKNLFDVAMGDFSTQATEFVDKLNNVLGVDPSEAMRYLGFFQQMTTAMGMASDRAYIVSKNMTQFGYDLASFINIPIEDAMQKVQSGLAGELEPLRRVGYALSQATLQQVLYEHGINKRINSLTDAQKVELRYVALIEQSSKAQGDMARTLNSPANQLRILKQSFVQAARAIGNIFLPLIQKVLPWIIAFANIIRNVATAIAGLFGFTLPEFDYDGLSDGVASVGDDADDASDSLGGVADSAKAAKKAVDDLTAPFDELNVLQIDTSTDTGSTGGGGGGGSTGTGSGGSLFDKLPEYDMFKNAIDSQVAAIQKKLIPILEIVSSLVTGIGIGMLAWKIASTLFLDGATLTGIFKGILGLENAMMKQAALMNFFKTPAGTALLFAATLAIIVARFVYLVEHSKKFRTGLKRAGEILDGIKTALGNIGSAFYDVLVKPIVEFLAKLLPKPIVDFFKTMADWLAKLNIDWGDLLVTIAGIALLFIPGGQVFGAVLLGFEALTVGIRLLGSIGEETWTKIKEKAAEMFSKETWEAIFGKIKDALLLVISYIIDPAKTWNLIIDSIKDAFKDSIFSKIWGGITKTFNNFITGFKNIVTSDIPKIVGDIVSFFAKLPSLIWTEIIKIITNFGKWCSDVISWVKSNLPTIISTLVLFFAGAPALIFTAISLVLGKFDTWKTNCINWVKTFVPNIISSIVTFFSEVPSKIKSKLDGFKSKLSEWVSNAKTWVVNFVPKVVNKIIDIFKNVPRGLVHVGKNILVGMWNGIMDAWGWFVGKIKSLFGKIGEKVADLLGSGSKLNYYMVPTYATGGVPDIGETFIARESGPEFVGRIGNRTTVMNNDQIVTAVSQGVASAVASVLASDSMSTTITNVLTLDGDTIYKNQKKVSSNRGNNFDMGTFAR